MKATIQEHHILYRQKDGVDYTVFVFKGEHHILTMMQRYCRNKVSQGFLVALLYFVHVQLWEKDFFELTKPLKKPAKKPGRKKRQ